MVTYRVVENPIRHWRRPTPQTLAVGATLVLSTVVLLSLVVYGETAPAVHRRLVPAASEQAVLRQVAAATRTTVLPRDVQPSLADVPADWGGNYENYWCEALQKNTTVVPCERATRREASSWWSTATPTPSCGSRHSRTSRSPTTGGWSSSGSTTARRSRSPSSTSRPGPTRPVPSSPATSGTWRAVDRINAHRPDLLVITQENSYTGPGRQRSPGPAVHRRTVAYRDDPTPRFPGRSDPGRGHPREHPRKAPVRPGVPHRPHPGRPGLLHAPTHRGEPAQPGRPGHGHGDRCPRLDTVPWFCTQTCPAYIHHSIVYWDSNHITATWAKYLEILLAGGRTPRFRAGGLVPDRAAGSATAGRHHRARRPEPSWSGCRDLNPGPLDPQSSVLTKLRHSPFLVHARAGHRVAQGSHAARPDG